MKDLYCTNCTRSDGRFIFDVTSCALIWQCNCCSFESVIESYFIPEQPVLQIRNIFHEMIEQQNIVNLEPLVMIYDPSGLLDILMKGLVLHHGL